MRARDSTAMPSGPSSSGPRTDPRMRPPRSCPAATTPARSVQAMHRRLVVAAVAALLGGCATVGAGTDREQAAAALRAAETAFAKSMADRDLAAFSALIAEDAVFIN